MFIVCLSIKLIDLLVRVSIHIITRFICKNKTADLLKWFVWHTSNSYLIRLGYCFFFFFEIKKRQSRMYNVIKWISPIWVMTYLGRKWANINTSTCQEIYILFCFVVLFPGEWFYQSSFVLYYNPFSIVIISVVYISCIQ